MGFCGMGCCGMGFCWINLLNDQCGMGLFGTLLMFFFLMGFCLLRLV